MTSFESVVLGLAVAYAVIGALLLVLLIYGRLAWPIKAAAIVLTTCFYLVSFVGARGLLGWSSRDPLPARFKLGSSNRIRSKASRERFIFGSRRLARIIVRAAYRVLTACPITPNWQQPRRGRSLQALTASRRAAGAPISDRARAVSRAKPPTSLPPPA